MAIKENKGKINSEVPQGWYNENRGWESLWKVCILDKNA